MKYSSTLTALAAVVPLISAQQEAAAYGQCGGQGHTGATSCGGGFYCNVYNDYYAQCIPGTSSSTSSCKTAITVTKSTSVTANATSLATSSSSSESAAAVYGSITLTYSVSSAKSSATAVSTAQTSVSSPSSSVTKAAASAKASTSKAGSSTETTLQTKVAATSTKKAATTLSKITSTKAASSAVATSTASAASTGSYPSASGTDFVIDGVTGYFPGTNAYWIGFLTNNSDVDLVMQHLKESGLKILRVWGFNDVTTTPSTGTVYFQSFAGSEPTINTGADGLERLDYVVKSAEAHGIKLIINFVNNWTDYGGMAAYFTYAGITDNTQWYNNTKAQTQYKKYIKAVVSRYPASSAIFAWELANEPRCTGCDLSIMTTWITSTAKYIKSLDPNRMVTTGEEGFGLSTGDDGTYPYETAAGGYNFATNCAIADIDFCVYHLYPESWEVTPTQSWGNAWITNHAKACAAAGKPCLLEEFGATDNCTIESSWQATALKATGTGGDLFWQYGDTLSTGESAQDGNTVYYGTDLYTCLVTNHVKAIDAQ